MNFALRYNQIMRYLLLSLTAASLAIPALAADVAVVEQIVCKVNGDIITDRELERDKRDAENQFRHDGMTGRGLADAIAAVQREALSRRIDNLLLIQKGKELDLKVDSDLARQLANLQRQSGLADPQAFQEWVHQGAGMPFEDYKQEMKNNLITQRVLHQEIAGSLKVKREELEAYYNAHKDEFQRKDQIYMRVIVLSTQGKDDAIVERKALDIVRRARAGEKFTELAQVNSDGASAQTGGDMPALTKEELRKEIVDAVWEKDRGYVTDPIHIGNEFQIYRVEEHQKAGLAEFEEVEQQVEDRVLGPRMAPATRAYLTKLRTQAFLEIKPGFVDAQAAPGKDTKWSDPAQLQPQTVTKGEVQAQTHHKKLLWLIPVPGTTAKNTGTSSSH